MLVFAQSRLTYLAVPKTGTTALETALRPSADVIFDKGRKHITARHFRRKVVPFLVREFGIETETVAVMRDPVDQIRSWYRYRSRAALAGKTRSTAEMSFDAFVRAVISDDPPECANIGSQFSFLTDAAGTVLVDHLFDYDAQDALLAFLTDRLGVPVSLRRENVSPSTDAPLSHATHEMLLQRRAEEFALYARLKASGYLHFA